MTPSLYNSNLACYGRDKERGARTLIWYTLIIVFELFLALSCTCCRVPPSGRWSAERWALHNPILAVNREGLRGHFTAALYHHHWHVPFTHAKFATSCSWQLALLFHFRFHTRRQGHATIQWSQSPARSKSGHWQQWGQLRPRPVVATITTTRRAQHQCGHRIRLSFLGSARTLSASTVYHRFVKRIRSAEWITPDLLTRKWWITGIVTRCVLVRSIPDSS